MNAVTISTGDSQLLSSIVLDTVRVLACWRPSGNTPAHFVWHMCTGSTVHKDRCLPYSEGTVPQDMMLHSPL